MTLKFGAPENCWVKRRVGSIDEIGFFLYSEYLNLAVTAIRDGVPFQVKTMRSSLKNSHRWIYISRPCFLMIISKTPTPG